MALNIDFNELARISAPLASEYSDEEMEEAREQVNQLMVKQGAVISKKNEKIITHGGYQFWKQNEYKEKVYWQCWKVKVDGCRARLHTKNTSGKVIKVVETHSCTRSSTAIPLRERQPLRP
uniref:FLYWCH-type domain-containing protein n=1 Tax=Ditylenchus dipsaci TaxID=166011 RepID=A0A915E8D9_9BILA